MTAPTEPTPPSTLILLVRHGATPTTGQILPGRAPGLHLAERGRQQADEVAQRLAGLPVTAIYSSPMERAQETAAPTAAAFSLPVVVEDGLNECDFGEWTGRRIADLAQLPEWQVVQKTPSQFSFPGGESFAEMQSRVVAALGGIAEQHVGEVVVCVSHADTIKAAVTELSGAPLDAFQRVIIDTAAISVAEFRGEDTAMRLSNSRTGSLAYLREQS